MGGFWGISAADMVKIPKIRALAFGRRAGGLRDLRPKAKGVVLGQQRQVHAAILFAFVFDLADLDAANFGSAGNMGAAAGLQINIADLDQPHLPLPHRRAH